MCWGRGEYSAKDERSVRSLMKTVHLYKRQLREMKTMKHLDALMKKKPESGCSWLTRTLFSILSPLISSLTRFLSDNFTFLPTASLTLSIHRREKRQTEESFRPNLSHDLHLKTCRSFYYWRKDKNKLQNLKSTKVEVDEWVFTLLCAADTDQCALAC